MDKPPEEARIAALTFAFLHVFGLLFFGENYFSPEHRSDVLIKVVPMVALIAAGAAPSRWYPSRLARSLVAPLAVIALPLLAVNIYRDLTSIDGDSWDVALLRSVEFVLLLLFVFVAVSAPRVRS
jgi:hypothetical protein